ncbi:MAG: glutamate racemase [Oligoflexia bacterium]|nr:glutamate racemase [Oligoflexia bacterium]
MRIGVFDSGVGGITVLTALRERIPEAEYVYLGDTANVPYGTKSPAQVIRLSLECARRLKQSNVDALVVACNTASSLANDALRAEMGAIPVFGVVEPGVQAVVEVAEARSSSVLTPVLVLATRATIRSGAYGRALRERLDPVKFPVFEQACPILVPMIEEGWIEHRLLREAVEEYVAPFRAKYPSGVALLGCTHYPWIQPAIEAALPGWTVVNSARALGRSLESRFPNAGRKGQPAGALEWIFTDPEALPEFARQFIKDVTYA